MRNRFNRNSAASLSGGGGTAVGLRLTPVGTDRPSSRPVTNGVDDAVRRYTSSTTFPNVAFVSTRACASAIPVSGKTASITGRTRSRSRSGTT
jgi:hypothetical protein